MSVQYLPSLQGVRQVEFRSYMVETSYDYCLTVLLSRHERGHVRQALGALAIEIILKSHFSQPASNHGSLDERYAIDRSALPAKRSELHG